MPQYERRFGAGVSLAILSLYLLAVRIKYISLDFDLDSVPMPKQSACHAFSSRNKQVALVLSKGWNSRKAAFWSI